MKRILVIKSGAKLNRGAIQKAPQKQETEEQRIQRIRNDWMRDLNESKEQALQALTQWRSR